eukprot:6228300-Pyramimonas_sp.AAC.1
MCGTLFQAKHDGVKFKEIRQRIAQEAKRQTIADLQRQLDKGEQHVTSARASLLELQAEQAKPCAATS